MGVACYGRGRRGGGGGWESDAKRRKNVLNMENTYARGESEYWGGY